MPDTTCIRDNLFISRSHISQLEALLRFAFRKRESNIPENPEMSELLIYRLAARRIKYLKRYVIGYSETNSGDFLKLIRETLENIDEKVEVKAYHPFSESDSRYFKNRINKLKVAYRKKYFRVKCVNDEFKLVRTEKYFNDLLGYLCLPEKLPCTVENIIPILKRYLEMETSVNPYLVGVGIIGSLAYNDQNLNSDLDLFPLVYFPSNSEYITENRNSRINFIFFLKILEIAYSQKFIDYGWWGINLFELDKKINNARTNIYCIDNPCIDQQSIFTTTYDFQKEINALKAKLSLYHRLAILKRQDSLRDNRNPKLLTRQRLPSFAEFKDSEETNIYLEVIL